MRPPRLGTLFALAACLMLVLPASAVSIPQIGEKHNGFSITDERYAREYVRCFDAFGADCGRNLLDSAWKDTESVSEQRLEAATERMRSWRNPPEPAPVAVDSPASIAPTPVASTVAPVAASTGGCPSSMYAESGSAGYDAYNSSSGAAGCYQVIPSTAAAHGCDLSTPAGQDACAQIICATEGPGAWSASGANPC